MSPFFTWLQSTLEEGVDAGWYDVNNTLQCMIFHWVFIPWLQAELDNYQDRINHSQKRCDKKKVLPHGIPDLIYHCAEDYGALDFKVMVAPGAIDYIEQLYVTQNHIIFDLVPASLNNLINLCYDQLGRPPVGCSSMWTVYCENMVPDTEVDLLLGLCDLHETDGYLGGVANSLACKVSVRS
ncbi:hypothetical protein EDD15DRAFT_2379814 [Pisolithus albus]|nr:hypothetical protein EDD15DRAFT_2379814 [Pisolithus albus]